MPIPKIQCYLCKEEGATLVDTGQDIVVVRECSKCVRYQISRDVIQMIMENSPTNNIGAILLDLSAAAKEIADAGREPPPERLQPYSVEYEKFPQGPPSWVLRIGSPLLAAEIVGNYKLLRSRRESDKS